MREVGPGRPLFRRGPYTQAATETPLRPIISDWRNFETWQLAGSPTALEAPTASGRNASRLTKNHPWTRPSPKEIDAFVTRRTAEAAPPTDFERGVRTVLFIDSVHR